MTSRLRGPAYSLCVPCLPLEHPSLLLLLPLLLPHLLAVFAGPPRVHATAQWRLSAGHKGPWSAGSPRSAHLSALPLEQLAAVAAAPQWCALAAAELRLLPQLRQLAAQAQQALPGLWLWLLRCCWLELQLLICWLMLAVAIIQVRGPPCSIPLSLELLQMLQICKGANGARGLVLLPKLCCFPCLIPWLSGVHLMIAFSINGGI